MTKQDPLWMSVFGLTMLVLVLLGSCQAYRECLADGRPRYECAHYARPGR